MLGRLYGRKGEIGEASKSFALTRELVNNGAPDPLGLGVASFGEEARLHLKRAQALQKVEKMSAKQRRENDHEIIAAVRLYAKQAAHGSTIGIDSLREVIDEVLGYDSDGAICDPIVQRLLVTRTLNADTLPDSDRTPSTSQISGLVRSVQKCGSSNLIDADRLAAIAYRDGDYQLAHTLATQMTTPLAMWVQARLQMQKGDVGEAAKYYAAASKAFPPSGDASEADQRAQALLVGENGVLTLSRGEYVDALEQLYPYAATFWGDVAYIAERVLTVDELKTFVDTHRNTQFNPSVSLDNLALIPDKPTDSTPGDSENDSHPADWLPNLLARRLVRAGRYREALNYVPALEVKSSTAAAISSPAAMPTVSASTTAPFAVTVGQTQFIPESVVATKPKRQKHWHKHLVRESIFEVPEDAIAEYIQGLNDANTARSNVDRARGWYRAAMLAGNFKAGNKIMGTEGEPDYYMQPYIGEGTGQRELHDDDRFVTDGERRRFKASAPKPNLRYHYIFVGADEAIRAAALLPPRSQAFAAVLCHATSWMTDGESCPANAAGLRTSPTAYASEAAGIANPLTVDALWPDESAARINLTCQLYQRYLKEGAVVPLATDFGQDCPEPDFASAVQFVQVQTIREARRQSRIVRHRWIVLVKLLLVALCLAASTWWFLRHRYV